MLVSSLIALAAAYGLGVWRLWRAAGVGKGISLSEVSAFAAGWAALVIALIGALHELAESLLSAHMIQHELLMVVAAPLIALSSPFVAFAWLLRPFYSASGIRAAGARRRWFIAASRSWAAITTPATVWLLHALALWLWHLPSLYEAAVRDEMVHALQHLSFFGSACLFWWGIARGRYGRLGTGAAVIYVFTTALHSGALGALLTFSSSLWYPIYGPTSSAWGLTALEDQQIAGLIMWVPASVVFTAVGLGFLALWIRESDRRVRATV